jgi:hypothetical protein
MTIVTHYYLSELETRARSGTAADIDFLLSLLHGGQSLTVCKMVDYALSQVASPAGEERIRYHLFHGENQMQRNYAALYFKRRGAFLLLRDAVRSGCIDEVQAYSR